MCIFEVLNFLLHYVEFERFDYSALALDVSTVVALANTLWNISLHDQYKNNLIENIQIIHRLEIALLESKNTMEKNLLCTYLAIHYL